MKWPMDHDPLPPLFETGLDTLMEYVVQLFTRAISEAWAICGQHKVALPLRIFWNERKVNQNAT
jgi:hypothetical protein